MTDTPNPTSSTEVEQLTDPSVDLTAPASSEESFGEYYQRFLGYPADEAWAQWSSSRSPGYDPAIYGSPWFHPVTKSGLIGVGSLAATLLIGVSLSNETPYQPDYRFRDYTPSSATDSTSGVSGHPASSPVQKAEPMLSAPEFSPASSSAAPKTATPLSPVSVSRTPGSAMIRTPIPPGTIEQQTEELQQLVNQLNVYQAARQPLTPSVTPSDFPAPDLLANSQDSSRSISDGAVADRLPSFADSSLGGVAAPETQPLEFTPSASPDQMVLVPTEQSEPAQSIPLAPVIDSIPASVEELSTPIQTDPTPQFGFDQSTVFTSYAVAAPELWAVYPESTNLSARLSPLSTTELGQGESGPSMTQVSTPEPESIPFNWQGVNLEKPDQTTGILELITVSKQLLSEHGLSTLPLTHQAAVEALQSNQIAQFQVYRLPSTDYQRVLTESYGITQETLASVSYGFIDYERQIIVMPVTERMS